MSIETGYLQAGDGRRILYRSLVPESPQALVIILHGVSEHSGRYEQVMESLGCRAYAVFVPDHRGHGRGARTLADIESFDRVLEDVGKLRRRALQRVPGVPLFLFGHSMGGLLALLYALEFQGELTGLILSGTLAKLPEYVSPFLVKISSVMARLLPLLPVQDFDYTQISRDPAVIRRIEEDDLHYKGKIRARTGFEMLKGMRRVEEELGRISLPVLILCGGEDVTVSPESSELIFQGISSRDKTKRLFAGLRHDILNEPEKEEVLAVIGDWIEKRI